MRLGLPRAVLERLMVRAHREAYPSLAAWVQAVLEREGRPAADDAIDRPSCGTKNPAVVQEGEEPLEESAWGLGGWLVSHVTSRPPLCQDE